MGQGQDRSPTRHLVVLLLAAAAWAQDAKELEKAVESYTKAIEKAPEAPDAYVSRGRVLQALDRHKDASQDFTKALELSGKPEALIRALRGLSSLQLDDYDAAIADCGKAIELQSDEVLPYYVRAGALRGKREDAAALRDYDKIIELNPRSFNALRDRGRTKEALRDFKGAIEDYTGLTGMASRLPGPFAARASAKMCLEDWKGALEDYEAVFYNEDPQDPDRGAHVQCARAHLALGRKEEAEAELQKAVEPPAGADAFSARGRFYHDTGRCKEAAADLAKGIQLDPTRDYERFFLFLARSKLGERKEAAAELKAYADTREKKDDWYSRVVGMLSGSLQDEEFFAAAKSANPQIAIEQECEACFYAGSIHLLDGDEGGAKALFERCLKTDVRNFIEYESSKMALAAVK